MRILKKCFLFFMIISTFFMGSCNLKEKAVFYECELEFEIMPTKSDNAENQYDVYGVYGKNVMDNMIKLLNSESFAENLMTDGLGDISNEYRQTEEYKIKLAEINNSIKYSWRQSSSNYIRVMISTTESKEATEDFKEKIKEELPVYIKANMAVPSGYDGTSVSLSFESEIK